MKITEIVAAQSAYDPNAVYLHGSKQQIQGGALKRYGKNGSDMGALFFCKDSLVGRWYSGTYGEIIHLCRLKPPVDQIFDFTNPTHQTLLRRMIDPQHFQSMVASSRNGHLDWTQVDDDLFGELGFRGMIFLERQKGMETGVPAMPSLPEDVLSVAIFDAADVEIIGTATREQLWKEAGLIQTKRGEGGLPPPRF